MKYRFTLEGMAAIKAESCNNKILLQWYEDMKNMPNEDADKLMDFRVAWMEHVHFGVLIDEGF